MKIDKKQVLRYLGYKGQYIDKNINSIIDKCVKETENTVQNKFLYEVFPLVRDKDYMYLKGTNVVLRGKDIHAQLKKSKSCALMAVTIGSGIEKSIRYYEKVSLTKATIMDACATVAVEALCDKVEQDIRKIAENQGLYITERYSPGYGDFSIDIQKNILRVLETYRIGLTCTDNFILMPRKSVTALIGIGDTEYKKRKSCRQCSNYKNCIYRKDDNHCGN